MAIQPINNGAFDNDPMADTLRVAFEKTNENFTEHDGRLNDLDTQVDALDDAVDDLVLDLGNVQTIANQASIVAQAALDAVRQKFEVYDGTATGQLGGTTSEIILKAIRIPATRTGVSGFTLNDCALTFLCQMEKLISHTGTFKAYLSTSPSSVSGLSTIATIQSASTIGYQPLGRTVKIGVANGSNIATVTVFNQAVTANVETSATYQVVTQTVNVALDQYLVFTITNGDTTGWGKYHQCELIVKRHTS